MIEEGGDVLIIGITGLMVGYFPPAWLGDFAIAVFTVFGAALVSSVVFATAVRS